MLAGFQLLIAATGNYGFFNLLTLVLCLLLLDDAGLPRALARVDGRAAAADSWTSWQVVGGGAARRWSWPSPPTIQIASAVGLRSRWPRPMVALYRALQPFRTFNPYGLFAVMTPTRPEIVIEGSRDGAAGRPTSSAGSRATSAGGPAFVAPHMPRLDWQMWFAALGGCEDSPWFQAFLRAPGRGLAARARAARSATPSRKGRRATSAPRSTTITSPT